MKFTDILKFFGFIRKSKPDIFDDKKAGNQYTLELTQQKEPQKPDSNIRPKVILNITDESSGDDTGPDRSNSSAYRKINDF